MRAVNEDWVEESLAELAHTHNPVHLAAIARDISYYLNQDSTPPGEDERQRRRGLRLHRRDNGTYRLEGDLSFLCAEALQCVLDSLGKPKLAQDGAPDSRTAGQRQHDALYDALQLALRSEKLPDCGGVAATILLIMTPEQFHTGDGLAQTGHGAQIPVFEAMTLFGDARIMPVVLGKTQQITAYGHTHRIFTETQRLAMTARDRCCTFPGCTDPPSRCQSHHITEYSITKRTSVDDGTLLCGLHPRTPQTRLDLPDDERHPPLDRTQLDRPHPNPKRNRAHHLTDVRAQTAK